MVRDRLPRSNRSALPPEETHKATRWADAVHAAAGQPRQATRSGSGDSIEHYVKPPLNAQRCAPAREPDWSIPPKKCRNPNFKRLLRLDYLQQPIE